ncbi:MAG: hypothetical protein WBD10_11695 [Acidobacteriaceae bacterium]
MRCKTNADLAAPYQGTTSVVPQTIKDEFWLYRLRKNSVPYRGTTSVVP